MTCRPTKCANTLSSGKSSKPCKASRKSEPPAQLPAPAPESPPVSGAGRYLKFEDEFFEQHAPAIWGAVGGSRNATASMVGGFSMAKGKGKGKPAKGKPGKK
jgi:hypothetical protein